MQTPCILQRLQQGLRLLPLVLQETQTVQPLGSARFDSFELKEWDALISIPFLILSPTDAVDLDL